MLGLIDAHRMQAGLAFNPGTAIPRLAFCLPYLAFVVVLTTEPEPAERAAFRRRLLERGAYFWLAARARLAPGGLLCQWAHTYDMSHADLQTLVRTFASVFPDGSLWLVGDGGAPASIVFGSRRGATRRRWRRC